MGLEEEKTSENALEISGYFSIEEGDDLQRLEH